MSKKVYRTAQGKTVDLGALQLQNEDVRAVGNMGINARGDKLNANNKSVEGRSSRIGKQYKKQIRDKVQDYGVPTGSVKNKTIGKHREVDATPVKNVEEPTPVIEDPAVKASGLAGAIARAKETPEPVSQEQEGVTKI